MLMSRIRKSWERRLPLKKPEPWSSATELTFRQQGLGLWALEQALKTCAIFQHKEARFADDELVSRALHRAYLYLPVWWK
jgi:hypothetical protein